MREKAVKFLLVLAASLIPTVLVWLPFFTRTELFWKIPLPGKGMETIVSNYDGPLYITVAKTLYNKSLIESNFQFPLPSEYYAAHFPLFPLLIRFFGNFTNYPYAMLIVTLLSSIAAIFFFEKLISQFVSKKDAIFLTVLFSVFPARWLVVRSVGSADPLFVAAIIASIYYFRSKKYLFAGVAGLIAQITKSPGILLFISYALFIFITVLKDKVMLNSKTLKKINPGKIFPVFFIPLGLLAVFVFYHFSQGDFWAYFKSGDNIHLFFPPFQIFNYSSSWVGTFWLEEVIFIYLISAIGVYRLFAGKEYEIATFSAVFFIISLFITHRDLMRYLLPLIPFLFVAYRDILIKKEFKIAVIIILIPIYLFSLAFISQNVMPISNWAPFI